MRLLFPKRLRDTKGAYKGQKEHPSAHTALFLSGEGWKKKAHRVVPCMRISFPMRLREKKGAYCVSLLGPSSLLLCPLGA